MNDAADAFLEFIADLTAALPDLCERSEDDPQSPRLRVVYNPDKKRAEAGEILIGLGYVRDATGQDIEQPGVVLQHKGSSDRSLGALLQHADDERIADWRRRLGQPATPAALRATLYVEDASPDSCLGLVLFLARLLGVPRAALPALWCDYADRWEQGDVRTTGQPFASWGCLHSALGHSFIPPSVDPTQAGGHGIETAFPICLRYLLDLLAQGVDPARVPDDLPRVEHHHRARLQLQRDYQAYRHSLASAELLQLRVPLQGGQRHLLVDAYLVTEMTASGTAKAFARNDREHAWFGQGFSLMALYRPLAKPGEDLAVSVDPAAGIHLEELWRALERLEDRRWGDERPRDRPRPLESYEKQTDGPGPNEPWWDDGGRYTLVAAPLALADGRPGGKATWQDVREQLWACYHPARALRFVPPVGARNRGRPLHEFPATRTAPGGKRLLIVRWDRGNGEPLVLTPTLQRYLAACAECDYPEGVPVDALPDAASFDVLNLPGGFAVIHARGVLLVDDWSNRNLPIEACQAEFDRITRRLDAFHRIGARADELVGGLRTAVDAGQRLAHRDLVRRLSQERLRLRTALFDTRAESEDVHVLRFRALLEQRWGLAGQRAELHETLEQLDTLVRDHLSLHGNRLINNLTLYGFPAALMATIFSGNVLQHWGEDGTWWGGIHQHGLWVALGSCATVWVAFWLWNRRAQQARLDAK
ncbi:MAG: hypothetical protein P9F75_15395 [Candidatus Contendobacter sp.]|nr:hypothetical protein [Candidatus Contendobacter sp.]